MQTALFTNIEWNAPQRDADRLQRDLGRVMKIIRAGRSPSEYLRAVQRRRHRLWWRSAQMGISSSRWIVGRCFADGLGVPQDSKESVRWYRLAAARGCLLAQTDLGSCYTTGQGVEKNCRKAVRWYEKAADQGCGWAQLHLARHYLKGKGVPGDEMEGVRRLREAADQNFAAAEYHLGVCYLRGTGVARDPEEAVTWLRRSALHGFAPAKLRLVACASFLRHKRCEPDPLDGLQRKLAALDAHESHRSSILGSLFGVVQSGNKAKRKAEIILATPVPAGKSKLLEFLASVVARGDAPICWRHWSSEQRVRNAWRTKAKEALHKARVLALNDRRIFTAIKQFESTVARWRTEEKKEAVLKILFLPLLALFSLIFAWIREEV